MVEKSPTMDELFTTAPLSDPLKTYKENVGTLKNLVELSTRAVKKRTDAILESLKLIEQWKKEQADKITEETEKVKKYQDDLAQRVKWYASLSDKDKKDMAKEYEELEELNKKNEALIKDILQLISDRKEQLALLTSFHDKELERYKASLESHKLELPALMQMAFIYLVAVWDAFILDTARAILRIHPELISKAESKTDLTKLDLWSLGTTEELRETLMESEIRGLDINRKKLVETFDNYWGIDWGESGVSIDIIVEIRARRDLWVHNRGRVNNQYIQMVKGQTSFNLGQIADIDSGYFTSSLVALTKLAVCVHRLANEKHYSKST